MGPKHMCNSPCQGTLDIRKTPPTPRRGVGGVEGPGGLVLHGLPDAEVGVHDLRDLRQLVLRDDLHVQSALHCGNLELGGELLEPGEDILSRLVHGLLMLRLILHVLAALLGHRACSTNRADQLAVDGHLPHIRQGTLRHQTIDDGLEDAVVLQPDAELGCGLTTHPTSDEEGLEVDRILGGGLVQLTGSLGPRARRGSAVSRGVTLDRRTAQELLILAQEADDECVQIRILRPLTPRLEGAHQLVDLAPVREGMGDRLRVGTLVGEVTRGDDGLDRQLGAVERVALEQLEEGILKLGLGLIQLIHEQDHRLVDLPLDREEARSGVIHALVVGDEGEAKKIGGLEDGEVQVADPESLINRRLLGHLGLADTGLAEGEHIAARADIESQDVHVRVVRDLNDASQHDYSLLKGSDRRGPPTAPPTQPTRRRLDFRRSLRGMGVLSTYSGLSALLRVSHSLPN